MKASHRQANFVSHPNRPLPHTWAQSNLAQNIDARSRNAPLPSTQLFALSNMHWVSTCFVSISTTPIRLWGGREKKVKTKKSDQRHEVSQKKKKQKAQSNNERSRVAKFLHETRPNAKKKNCARGGKESKPPMPKHQDWKRCVAKNREESMLATTKKFYINAVHPIVCTYLAKKKKRQSAGP